METRARHEESLPPATPARPGDPPEGDMEQAEELRRSSRSVLAELGKLVVGQHEVLEQLLVAVFARGHCLMEGVPGLAKTTIVSALASAMDLSFRRIQFTPDLMPSDITGTEIIQEVAESRERRLKFYRGPVFAQMVLADEINRAPPKTQSALLEAMQEGRVTVGDQTYSLDQPFFVLATQNPLEQEGTYPLPEAQRDRFMLHVVVRYPTREEEREILRRTTTAYEVVMESRIDGPTILECQRLVRRVPVPEHVYDFVLDLTRRTRPEEAEAPEFVRRWLTWGAGPRASQYLILGAKARAVLRGRTHATIDDVRSLAAPVLRHRIQPSFQAEAEGLRVDDIVERLVEATAARE